MLLLLLLLFQLLFPWLPLNFVSLHSRKLKPVSVSFILFTIYSCRTFIALPIATPALAHSPLHTFNSRTPHSLTAGYRSLFRSSHYLYFICMIKIAVIWESTENGMTIPSSVRGAFFFITTYQTIISRTKRRTCATVETVSLALCVCTNSEDDTRLIIY